MSAQTGRRFLVIGRVGDRSLHPTWIADTACERNWDLQLNAYGKDESLIQNGDLPPVIDRGTKWDSLIRHFKAQPELLDRYDYIFMPDDDLILAAGDINRLFTIAVEHNLNLVQPSLTPDSYIVHMILMRSPQFRLRYTNFVEPMAPCLKTSYLKALLPFLERHHIGWGVDFVWALLMKDPTFRAAVVDDVPMVHTRPVLTGDFYKRLADQGIDPFKEVETIRSHFENPPSVLQVYGGVLRDGRRVGARETRLRSAIDMLGSAFRARNVIQAVRGAGVMTIRAVTQSAYQPEQLRPAAGSPAAAWIE